MWSALHTALAMGLLPPESRRFRGVELHPHYMRIFLTITIASPARENISFSASSPRSDVLCIYRRVDAIGVFT
jgi:hypothetical protein